jgi:hypothetical protein
VVVPSSALAINEIYELTLGRTSESGTAMDETAERRTPRED